MALKKGQKQDRDEITQLLELLLIHVWEDSELFKQVLFF